MALQHHFVVVVEDGKLFIDDDTTDHKFYDGSVWNTEIQDWEANYDHATQNETARELLWDKLNKENA
jgi:L-rhamnose isomerase